MFLHVPGEGVFHLLKGAAGDGGAATERETDCRGLDFSKELSVFDFLGDAGWLVCHCIPGRWV